jgi:hypothetical protein
MEERRAMGHDFSRGVLIASLAFAVIVLIASLAFFEFTLTGRVAGDFVIEKALAGETIEGTFLYRVGDAGILPLDSNVVLSINTLTKQMPLRDVIDPVYIDKAEIVEYAPYVEAMLALSDISPATTGSSGGKGSSVTSVNSGSSVSSSNAIPEDDSAIGVTSSPGAPVAAGESASTTANVIAEVITGERLLLLRAGEDVEVTLPPGKFGRIESVKLRGQKVDSSLVSLTQQGTTARIRSLYTEKVEGFSDPELRVPLNLGKFSFTTPRKWADLHISFVYKEETFATSERSVIVDSEVVPEDEVKPGVTPGTPVDTPGENRVCGVEVVCGPYSACSSPSFSGLVTLEGSTPELVQSRTCYDEVCGTTFTDTQLCIIPSAKVDLSVIADDSPSVDSPTDTPSVTPRQTTRASSGVRSDSPRVHEYTEQDLLLYGSVTRELQKDAEIVVNVRGDDHSVSVQNVDGNRVRIRVASTPQEADVLEGETRVFDLDGDRNYDLSVTVIKVEGDSAVVSVAPYEGTRENPLAPGEEGVVLTNEKLSAPVAQVIFDDQLPTLRVLLMQSGKRYPLHCYNMIKDINEAGADCGGPDCRQCHDEEKEHGALIWWILSLASALLLTLIVRARMASV